MNTVIYAWIATIIFSFGTIVGKIASKYHIANPWLYNFVWTSAIVLFVIPVCLYFGVSWPSEWMSLHIAGFLSAFAGAIYIYTLSKVDVSVLSPMSNIRIPIIMLLSYWVFYERLPPNALVYITIIVIGGVVLGIDESFSFRKFFKGSFFLIIVMSFFSALYNISIKYALQTNTLWNVTFWSNVLTLPWTLLTIPLFWHDIKKTNLKRYSGIVFSSFIVTFGMVFEFFALQGSASIAITIISLPMSMILAILLSVIAPQLLEKHTWKVYAIRVTAAAVMFGSAVMLSK